MKNLFLCICTLFVFTSVIAQKQAIKITNTNTAKEKIIKENKRIKLQTIDGRKIKGRFQVENNNTIIVDGFKIDLNDINELKRNPLLTSVLTSSFLVYMGGITAGFAVIIGVLADTSAYWLLAPAAGLVYVGTKSPNINKNHKTEKGWRYEIITITE